MRRIIAASESKGASGGTCHELEDDDADDSAVTASKRSQCPLTLALLLLKVIGRTDGQVTATAAARAAAVYSLFFSRCFAGTALLLMVTILPFIIYVISFHRIQTFRDFMAVMHVWSLPIDHHNNNPNNIEKNAEQRQYGRCKIYNATHRICLPNLFLIGASKCGTTSLMDYLLSHPDVVHVRRRIYPSDRHREIHRFDRNSFRWAFHTLELMDEWASSPIIHRQDSMSATTAVIHYTPHYLYAPTVPFEMRTFYPYRQEDMMFIVSLREPIQRALSSYWFQNSHLFDENGRRDQGSIDDFQRIVKKEMVSRKMYDDCMMLRNGGIDVRDKNEKFHLHVNFTKMELLAADYSSTRLAKDENTTASATSLEAQRNRHFNALKECIGASNLRSAILGGRHLDKGIYVDQILRWRLNFPRAKFYFMNLGDWGQNENSTGQEMETVFDFIFERKEQELEKEKNGGHDMANSSSSSPSKHLIRRHPDINFSRKRLSKPNSLSLESSQQLPLLSRRELEAFFRPYNDRLVSLLGPRFNFSVHYDQLSLVENV